jgi:hypothetical protein
MLNWTRRVTADGVVFYPPEGRDRAGVLRLREYIRPLRRLREIRADQVARLSTVGATTISEPVREITIEGEHAVLYKLDVAGPTPLEVFVGVTFGDDGYLLVEGMCGDSTLAATFASVCRRLTLALPMGLGGDRRRRYQYEPPPGWQAVVKRHAVVWYPPDYPRNHAAIHVFDAKKIDTDTPGNLERMVIQEPQNTLQSFTDSAVMSVLTDTGLKGAYEVLRGTWMGGTPSALVRSTLMDSRFSYSLRLEASEPGIDAAREIFDRVVRSVHRVPMPLLAQSQAVIHWND